jgi:hypothetical protein
MSLKKTARRKEKQKHPVLTSTQKTEILKDWKKGLKLSFVRILMQLADSHNQRTPYMPDNGEFPAPVVIS